MNGATSVFKISREESRTFLGKIGVRYQQGGKSIFFFKTSRPVPMMADSFIVGGQDFVLGASVAGA